MKRFTCPLILFSAAALCGCVTTASASPPEAALPSSAKTSALAATSWSPTVKTILAESKATMGGAAWNNIHSLRIKGTVKLGGLTGSFTTLEDTPTGRSVMHFKLGPVAGARGFDGKQGWAKAPGGEVAPSDSPAAKKAAATAAYELARAWWFPARWPAKIESLDTRSDAGKTFQVLRVTPRDGHPFELWINAKTHLIARRVDRSGILTRTKYFSDYRTVHGVKIAFHQRLSKGKKRYDRVLQLNKVTVNVPVNAKDFVMPGQKLDDFSIIGGGDTATIPFNLANSHIYVPVTVNGHELQLMLDSGGRNALSPKAAKRAGIASKGALQGGGGGMKSVNMGIGKAKTLVLGNKIELRKQNFLVLPIPEFADGEGTEYDGYIGYELFKRFVVRIDYADQKLTFIKPGDFNPADAGTAVPFTSAGGGMPIVKASIDGLSGNFEIDTGDAAPLILFAPFIHAHHLDSRYTARSVAMSGGGIGGSSSKKNASVARGSLLKIGAVAVANPVMQLSAAQKGGFAAKHVAGNIGGAILKRFTVTFDDAHQKMYLKPNKLYGTPMNYDRSGMVVYRNKRGFNILFVTPNGPADQAGLKAGEVITKVNGKSTADIGLNKFQRMLRNETPGTKVRVVIDKGKAAHNVTITLRRLIPETGGLGPKPSSPNS